MSGRKIHMANILNKMLDFVGWETEEIEEEDFYEEEDMDEVGKGESYGKYSRKNQGKVLNLNNSSNTKVVIVVPRNINDTKEICEIGRASCRERV